MKDYASLEMSTKIQDAGIKIDTAMVWVEHWCGMWLKKQLMSHQNSKKMDSEVITPAPSISEIVDKLPTEIKGNYFSSGLSIEKKSENVYMAYYNFEPDTPFYKTLSEALSRLLLWAKEGGHL